MIAALALLLLAQAVAPQGLPAPGAQIGWELVLEEADGRIFIDPASVSRDRAMVRFNVRMVSTGGSELYLLRQALDCARRTVGFEAGAIYDRQGRLLRSREDPPGAVEMRPIEAGTAEELFHRRLCAGSTTS